MLKRDVVRLNVLIDAEEEKLAAAEYLKARAQVLQAELVEAYDFEVKACDAEAEAAMASTCALEGELEQIEFELEALERTEDEELDMCIAEKEALLEDRRCYAESIIGSKSKEVRKLITGIEEAEEHNAAKMKEVADIDVKVGELQTMRARLQVECEARDEVRNKLFKKRKELEVLITGQINEYKSETSMLEIEIRDLKLKQSKHTEDKVLSEVTPVKTLNHQLLDYIDHKIKVKEGELECSVCLEVASVPIFMCDELHLICSSCRPKVSECPECRQPYLGRPRRHRYAERVAEELDGLRGERGQIVGD